MKNILYIKKTEKGRLMAMTALLCLVSIVANCQSATNSRLQFFISRYNMSFSIPSDYMECDSIIRWGCRDAQLTNAIVYSIIKKDSSVKIGFSFVEVMSEKTLENLKFRFPNLAPPLPNENYLRSAKVKADTISSGIKYYDDNYVKSVFNADHALSISRACRVPYFIWNHNRIVYVAKDNRCHVEITYFFTENASNTIYREIERTEGMLRFN